VLGVEWTFGHSAAGSAIAGDSFQYHFYTGRLVLDLFMGAPPSKPLAKSAAGDRVPMQDQPEPEVSESYSRNFAITSKRFAG
jgi:hypothetical protein